VSWRIGLLFAGLTICLRAESGRDAWLRYEALPERIAEADFQALGNSVTVLGSSEVLLAARDEYVRGIRGMLSRTPRHQPIVPGTGGVVIGLFPEVVKALPAARFDTGF